MSDITAVRAKNDPVRLGIYKHYKSTTIDPKYYQIIAVATHTETGEYLVVYVPLYVAGGWRVRARPLSLFVDRVEVEGEVVQRFEYVGTEIPEYSF